MTDHSQFISLMQSTFAGASGRLQAIGKEFSSEFDRLIHLHRFAAATGLDPRQAAFLLATQEWDVVQQYIKGIPTGEAEALAPLVVSRIDGAIAQLIQLKALIAEKQAEASKAKASQPELPGFLKPATATAVLPSGVSKPSASPDSISSLSLDAVEKALEAHQ